MIETCAIIAFFVWFLKTLIHSEQIEKNNFAFECKFRIDCRTRKTNAPTLFSYELAAVATLRRIKDLLSKNTENKGEASFAAEWKWVFGKKEVS